MESSFHLFEHYIINLASSVPNDVVSFISCMTSTPAGIIAWRAVTADRQKPVWAARFKVPTEQYGQSAPIPLA